MIEDFVKLFPTYREIFLIKIEEVALVMNSCGYFGCSNENKAVFIQVPNI
jgi:hypothetical protein